MYLKKELDLATKIAFDAALVALSMQSSIKAINKKNNEGPVSTADLAIDELIVSEIKKNFKKDLIISEESFGEIENIPKKGRVWFIDPIDGTKSYIKKEPDFVIMIGLAIDQIPKVGVIIHPPSNTLWRALINKQDDNLVQKIVNNKIYDIKLNLFDPKYLNLIISKYHPSKKQDLLIKALNPNKVIKISSIGLKAIYIIENFGNFYVNYSKKLKLWDTCAAQALIEALGLKMAYIDECPIKYENSICHKLPIFISNFKPGEELLKAVQSIALHD